MQDSKAFLDTMSHITNRASRLVSRDTQHKPLNAVTIFIIALFGVIALGCATSAIFLVINALRRSLFRTKPKASEVYLLSEAERGSLMFENPNKSRVSVQTLSLAEPEEVAYPYAPYRGRSTSTTSVGTVSSASSQGSPREEAFTSVSRSSRASMAGSSRSRRSSVSVATVSTMSRYYSSHDRPVRSPNPVPPIPSRYIGLPVVITPPK